LAEEDENMAQVFRVDEESLHLRVSSDKRQEKEENNEVSDKKAAESTQKFDREFYQSGRPSHVEQFHDIYLVENNGHSE